jgi:general secretion pathway protein I
VRQRLSNTAAAAHAPYPRVRQGVFARRAVPRFERSGGFTLMELIAAFVIFAIGFGVLLQILGGALHTTRQSAEYTQAALWAQSLLDIQGVGEPLKEGGRSGQFDDQFSYELNISKYQPIPVTSNNNVLQGSQVGAGAVITPGQMELYQLELVVSWGNQYLMHHARFVTLRAMGPPRNGGPISPLPGFGG